MSESERKRDREIVRKGIRISEKDRKWQSESERQRKKGSYRCIYPGRKCGRVRPSAALRSYRVDCQRTAVSGHWLGPWRPPLARNVEIGAFLGNSA